MSSALGPVSFAIDDQARANPLHPEYAEATASLLDESVRALLEEARQSAVSMLLANRAALDALASELLAREVVDRARLLELVRAEGTPVPTRGNGRRPPPDSEQAGDPPGTPRGNGVVLEGGDRHRGGVAMIRNPAGETPLAQRGSHEPVLARRGAWPSGPVAAPGRHE